MSASWDEIGVALRDVATGEKLAWENLLEQLSPHLEALARQQRIGRLRNDEDVHRDIVTKVIARLHAGEHKSIKKLVASDAPPPLEAWVRVLVRSAAIDVMRGRPEFRRANNETGPGWFSIATLVTRDGSASPDTLAAKQREVRSFLAMSTAAARELAESSSDVAAQQLAARWKIPILHTRRLVKKLPLYEPVLDMVLAGHSYPAVAEALEVSRRDVERIVGYIEEFCHARGFASS